MSQTSYEIEMEVAIEGMLADTSDTKDVLSLNNKLAVAMIGKLASIGAAEGEMIHPAAATDVTDLKKARGIVLHAHTTEQTKNDGLAANYPVGYSVPVLHKGRCWVKFEDAPSVSVQPSVRYAGAGVLGSFVSTPVGSETALLPNSKVLATAPGNFALIEIDL